MLTFSANNLDVYAKAQIAVNTINAEAGFPLLRIAPQPERAGGALSLAELVAYAQAHPGWYDVRTLFLAIRKADPSKGETIRTGQQMAAMGWQRRKMGTLSVWHVDNSTRASVG